MRVLHQSAGVLFVFSFAIFAFTGCAQSPEDAGSGPDGSAASPSFVNRVWQVSASSTVSPGQLYTFLSEGTLVIASPHGSPSLGTWFRDGEGLLMVEEGIPYRVEILSLTPSEFHLRMHGPGEPVEWTLVPATDALSGLPDSLAFRAPGSVAGRLAWRDGGLRFVACGEEGQGVPVEDVLTGEGATLLRDFGAGERGMTVLLRLENDRIREIRYAGLEGPTCSQLPPEGDLEARGNEPFWHVRVDGGTALFKTPENPDGSTYRYGRWARVDGKRWRFEASRGEANEREELALELTEEPCRDGMSGARYPYRATLVRGEARMEGCAIEGRRAVSPPE